MRRLLFVVIAGAAAGCANLTPTRPTDAAPVIAAERAFAARAGEIGWVPAFREYAASDGVMPGLEGYENAHVRLAQTPDDGNRNLMWWPAFAGIAQSGEIGFTAGPASFDEARTPRIYYFTIWRRQSDGGWRWIYDGGPGPVADPAASGPGDEPIPLAPGAPGLGRERALAEVRALEGQGDLAEHLASDAHVYRAGRPRAAGGAAAAENLRFPSASTSYTLSRIETSEAGDMVFVLGEARWTQDGLDRRGFTARVWQRRGDGWRIVYDHLIVRRPAP